MTPAKPGMLLLLLAVAGCAATDPYLREGVWRPTGANDHNLRAMIVVPAELARGTGVTTAEGPTAVDAVERLRGDRVRRLPPSGVAEITFGGGTGGAP